MSDYVYDSCLLSYSQPASSYVFKDSNRNTRTRREISLKLAIKIPEHQWRHSGVFIFNLNIFYILF